MTVSAGYAPAVYDGNGSTYQFPFSWPIQSADHLVVTKTVAGVDTVLVRGVDYLLVWVGAGATGTVRTVYYDGGTPINDPPATGETITLARVVPLAQSVDLRNHGPFLGEVIEQALDKATQIDQQQQAELNDHEVRIVDLENAPSGGGGGSYGVSVIDHGATGDGATDDTAAIQSAINAAFANGGGTVYFPSGVYRANNIMLKSKVLLQGEGVASVIKFTDDAYYSASPYHMDSLIRTASGSTVTPSTVTIGSMLSSGVVPGATVLVVVVGEVSSDPDEQLVTSNSPATPAAILRRADLGLADLSLADLGWVVITHRLSVSRTTV